jgi:hypothetical protein
VTLIDPYVHNFLLTIARRFHWVEFGWAPAAVDDPAIHNQGLIGYSLVSLLLSLYGENIRSTTQPSEGYSLMLPCRYCMDARLDALVLRHGWLHDVLDEVRRLPAVALTEPEFYLRLGPRMPERVRTPLAVIRTSKLLAVAGRLWMSTRKAVRTGRPMLVLKLPAKDRPRMDHNERNSS